jgi:hypothetical protein
MIAAPLILSLAMLLPAQDDGDDYGVQLEMTVAFRIITLETCGGEPTPVDKMLADIAVQLDVVDQVHARYREMKAVLQASGTDICHDQEPPQ